MDKYKIILLLTVCAMLFLLDSRGLLKPAREVTEKIFMPAIYAVKAGEDFVGSQFRVLTFWKSGEERIKNLEQKTWELESLRAENNQLKRENNFLRSQADVPETKGKKLVLANILGNSDFLVLDRGENDGVAVNDSVIWKNILIGTVYKVTPSFSFVILPTDTRSGVAVKIGMVRGLATGRYNTSVILDKVGQGENLDFERPVLTSGEGKVSVLNLLVGKLGKRKNKETDLFQQAEIVPAVDYKKVDQAFIVL